MSPMAMSQAMGAGGVLPDLTHTCYFAMEFCQNVLCEHTYSLQEQLLKRW